MTERLGVQAYEREGFASKADADQEKRLQRPLGLDFQERKEGGRCPQEVSEATSRFDKIAPFVVLRSPLKSHLEQLLA